MSKAYRAFTIAGALLLAVPTLRGQSAADPSGHWEGALRIPDRGDMAIEVDFAKGSKGDLIATFGNPAEKLRGLPLSGVRVDGRAVHFTLSATSGGGQFVGQLSADGKTMTGEFVTSDKMYTIPFSVTRLGDARIEASARNAALGKDLVGTWNGSLDVEGRTINLVLKLTNQADGSSTGSIAIVGQGAEIPLSVIKQNGASLALELKIVSATYNATLNSAGTELTGTWSQGPAALALTFRRATESKPSGSGPRVAVGGPGAVGRTPTLRAED